MNYWVSWGAENCTEEKEREGEVLSPQTKQHSVGNERS